MLASGAGLGVVLALAACGQGSEPTGVARRGGTLRVGALGATARAQIDPHGNLSNDSDFLVASLVYDALTVPGADPVVAPRLARSWETTDNRRWTFTLAEGATFHDGTPVTADDVVWSLRRLRSEAGVAKMPVAAENIAADGPGRVVLTLPEPNSQLPLLLRLMTFTAKRGTTDWSNAIGTGPFRLDSRDGGTVRLVRNDSWYGGPALLDALEITTFESTTALGNAVLAGQIDLASNAGAIAGRTAEGRPDLQIVRRPDDTMLGLAMRTSDGPFADPRVRAAIRLGVDRGALVNQVHSGYGTVANDVLGTADPGYDRALPQRGRDLERARNLLREANFDTAAGYPLVTKAEAPGEVESARVLAAQLAEIGLRLDVVTEESGVFYERTWLKAPLYTVSWGTNDSVIFYASTLLASTSNRNETAFRDPEFDAATAAALAAGDPAQLTGASRTLQRIQYDRGGYLVWGMADGIDVAAATVRDLPTLGGFARVQLERTWLAG